MTPVRGIQRLKDTTFDIRGGLQYAEVVKHQTVDFICKEQCTVTHDVSSYMELVRFNYSRSGEKFLVPHTLHKGLVLPHLALLHRLSDTLTSAGGMGENSFFTCSLANGLSHDTSPIWIEIDYKKHESAFSFNVT